MNFRRALCPQKPYRLLLNIDYEKFTTALVERYFQRCVFYGIWPGIFDQDDASKDPYWASVRHWYDRDRPLFKKYIPILRRLNAAGWQPITGATSDNPKIWLERFGEPSGGRTYLTACNDTVQIQQGAVQPSRDLPRTFRMARVTERISGSALPAAAKAGKSVLHRRPSLCWSCSREGRVGSQSGPYYEPLAVCEHGVLATKSPQLSPFGPLPY